jgi:HEAT repeat protein
MSDDGGVSLAVLVEALHDADESVASRAAHALVQMGPRVLPAVAPLLNANQAGVRAQATWIARKIADDRVEGGVRIGWPAELQRLMAAYDDTLSNRERARLTRAVLSLMREYPDEIGS